MRTRECGEVLSRLQGDRALVERILRELPPAPRERECVIRCSLANVDRAICRALALALVGELWRVEIGN